MTVKEKLTRVIKNLPDDMASQVFDFTLFIKERRHLEQEALGISQTPAFKRLAGRSKKETAGRETISGNKPEKEVKQ